MCLPTQLEYTATLLVMVCKCNERGWACTPPSPAWANFTLMIEFEYTPESSRCYSVYSEVSAKQANSPPSPIQCLFTCSMIILENMLGNRRRHLKSFLRPFLPDGSVLVEWLGALSEAQAQLQLALLHRLGPRILPQLQQLHRIHVK